MKKHVIDVTKNGRHLVQICAYNENHDPKTGEFTTGDGIGESVGLKNGFGEEHRLNPTATQMQKGQQGTPVKNATNEQLRATGYMREGETRKQAIERHIGRKITPEEAKYLPPKK